MPQQLAGNKALKQFLKIKYNWRKSLNIWFPHLIWNSLPVYRNSLNEGSFQNICNIGNWLAKNKKHVLGKTVESLKALTMIVCKQFEKGKRNTYET